MEISPLSSREKKTDKSGRIDDADKEFPAGCLVGCRWIDGWMCFPMVLVCWMFNAIGSSSAL